MHALRRSALHARLSDDGDEKARRRLVTIDYDICIGCANCVMACPYDARSIEHEPQFSYGTAMQSETVRFDEGKLGVATKCTFCKDRVDEAERAGKTPGVDPEVTPACVNSCISGAMHFGDVNDPNSNISQLLRDTQHFRMHEELGTDPSVFYIWDEGGRG